MYGLIGRFAAVPGKRDELISILLEGIDSMPGCLSYVVAKDPADDVGVWITEVWDTVESHKSSLQLPSVKDAVARAMPLIASFQQHIETEPVGGQGIGAQRVP